MALVNGKVYCGEWMHGGGDLNAMGEAISLKSWPESRVWEYTKGGFSVKQAKAFEIRQKLAASGNEEETLDT